MGRHSIKYHETKTFKTSNCFNLQDLNYYYRKKYRKTFVVDFFTKS